MTVLVVITNGDLPRSGPGLTTLASADPKDNYLTLLYKTHPLPQVRLDQLAPGLTTLDSIKGPATEQQSEIALGAAQLLLLPIITFSMAGTSELNIVVVLSLPTFPSQLIASAFV